MRPKKTITPWIALAVGLLLVAGGCINEPTAVAVPNDGCPFNFPGCKDGFWAPTCGELGYKVGPGSPSILKGDTIALAVAWGCPAPTWQVNGDAVSIELPAPEVATGLLRGKSVRVRGIRPGSAVLVAQFDSGGTGEVSLRVHDSSDVKHIVFDVGRSVKLNLQYSSPLELRLQLHPEFGRIQGAPTAVWSTDSTVIEVVRGTSLQLRPRAVGAAKIVAEFLSVRDTLAVEVVP